MNLATGRGHEPKSSSTGVGACARMFLFLAIAVIVAITVVRVWIWWRNGAGISFASGVMITMAADLRDGVFYRPLLDSAGYGGTRYFPLYFCLLALLLKLGMPILASAYLLSAAAIVLLMWGTFQLLRELGAEAWLATCAALMLLAASSVQLSLTTPQADGLAAALNVWGLAAIVPAPRRRRRILLASLLFTLAWSAKLTTVFGVAAAVVWLIATGSKRVAWTLAAETLCGYLIVASAMIVASRGRVVDIFRACASGGTDWRFIAGTPARIKAITIHGDSGLIWFVIIAAVLIWAMRSWKLLQNLPALLLIATSAVTLMIFASPGTAGNHLLDVYVATVILLVAWVATSTSPVEKQLGVGGLALLTLIAALPLARNLRNWTRTYHPHQFQQIIAAIGPTKKPILSENPIIPVLAGQHPYVIDPWMVQLLGKRSSGFARPLLEGLRNQSFSAVVLFIGDPAQKGGQWWYDNMSFGPGFTPALLDNYKLALIIDDDRIYLPKPAAERGAK